MSISGRGGQREGSGRPSPWNNKKTVAIRVPEVFVEEVVEYARRLDRGERVVNSDSVQNQKLLEMLKNALDVPTKSFGKGKVILREIVSILETAQNQ
ncbi:hypothetical protein [Chroococcidiopsis thermalis]|jgi:hypothetical protein|uniref:Uncharacterized protein n=1 Tax=Chroococcidiopsis thermalis (strain PCC 7203) TaxID=251229 RepID=K9U9P0_CHRTP|nr:hypothetical protein [Chroococcidiopsis thermalis]AFY91308.1 hypothetical protein Chro_5977 [Chroococcidiopsis thermalis PCC 7203]